MSAMSDNPWPSELDNVFERALTAEYATLTRSGQPITVPTTPYVGASGSRRTLDVSTGLTYPAKAERARRNPKVALLFADPIGSGLSSAPVALVQGLATVRDRDLQANTDRYVELAQLKVPDATKGQPKAILRTLAWYYARIWIEITPVVIRWWPDRSLATPPEEWRADASIVAPASDPAPPGTAPSPWLAPPTDWHAALNDAVDRLPFADLTVVGADGYPLVVPARVASLEGEHVHLEVGRVGAPGLAHGPACLTLHGHPEKFTGQENHTFVGQLAASPDTAPDERGQVSFRVERAIGDWSLKGNRLSVAAGFMMKGRVLRKRLVTEAERRGQAVPKVRL